MIARWALIAACGAIGTVARALVYTHVKADATTFPWSTVIVNLVGSFLFGVVFTATEGHARATDLRLAALTGFMGAFTTFSTLVFDTAELASAGRFGAAATNLLLQNAAGIVLIILGFAVGRLL
jgi:CrcB protein